MSAARLIRVLNVGRSSLKFDLFPIDTARTVLRKRIETRDAAPYRRTCNSERAALCAELWATGILIGLKEVVIPDDEAAAVLRAPWALVDEPAK